MTAETPSHAPRTVSWSQGKGAAQRNSAAYAAVHARVPPECQQVHIYVDKTPFNLFMHRTRDAYNEAIEPYAAAYRKI